MTREFLHVIDLVTLVHDLDAEQGFDHILECDQSLGFAILANDQRDVLTLLEQGFHQPREWGAGRDSHDFPTEVCQWAMALSMVLGHQQVFSQHESSYAIDVIAVDGQA